MLNWEFDRIAPCSHNGPCIKGICGCADAKYYCDRNCRCSLDCESVLSRSLCTLLVLILVETPQVNAGEKDVDAEARAKGGARKKGVWMMTVLA